MSLPSNNEENATVMEDLPDEMLLHIFNFMSAEDLVLNVSNVCTRWNRVVTSKYLWRNKVFIPPVTMNDNDIVKSIAKLPNLQHFRLKHGENVDKIIKTLCEKCPNIRSVIMERKRGPSNRTVNQIKFLKYLLNVETFNVFMPIKIFQFDYGKFNPNSRNIDTSLVITSRDMIGERYRLFNEIEQRFVKIINTEEKVIDILREKQNTLECLIMFHKLNKNISDIINKCKNLKHFLFFGTKNNLNILCLNEMVQLDALNTLQMIIPQNSAIFLNPSSKTCFKKLVKLELYCNCSLATDEIRSLWPICPNLEHLRFEASYLTDEAFNGIGKCKLLKHIDISNNIPGLYNEFLEFIAQGCYELEFLDLSYSLTPFKYDLSVLAPCKKLSSLWLENQIITNKTMFLIPTLFPNMTELNIRHCKCVSFKSVRRLKRTMKSINVIWENA